MITQTDDTPPLSRAQQDQLGVIDNRRAAHTARTHAAFYEALAGAVVPDPRLADFAEDAADILRRGYVKMCLQLLELADRAEAAEQDYRLHLVGERP